MTGIDRPSLIANLAEKLAVVSAERDAAKRMWARCFGWALVFCVIAFIEAVVIGIWVVQ